MPKKTKRKQGKKNVVEGGLAAVALGIAAGLFLMSKPGKKLRKDIKKKVGDGDYASFTKKFLKKYLS